MIPIRLPRTLVRGLLAGGAFFLATCLPAAAQVQTTTTTEQGNSTAQVTVQRGTIVYVSGNDVVVKLEDGSLKHFNNVPDNVTVTVDGKQLNVHQLQAGMKVERQTITTTTPRTIITTKTVTGKVWNVSPPDSVILTLANGKNQRFKIPRGQKFNINGQDTDAFGLRKGMNVSAQMVTEVPENVVTQTVKRTGQMPPPPPAPTADLPILVVVLQQAPVEIAAAPPEAQQLPAKLPKTASELPLIGLLGALLCGISLTASTIRKLIADYR